MRSACLFVLTCLAAAPLHAQAAPAAPRPPLPSDSVAVFRRFAGFILNMQADSLFAVMSPGFQQRMVSADAVRQQLQSLADQAGTETALIEERWPTRNGLRQYWRVSTFSGAPEPVIIRLVMNAERQLIGLGVNPASQAPPVDP